jgi:hypothetical protein
LRKIKRLTKQEPLHHADTFLKNLNFYTYTYTWKVSLLRSLSLCRSSKGKERLREEKYGLFVGDFTVKETLNNA